jgi:hypothetical protein
MDFISKHILSKVKLEIIHKSRYISSDIYLTEPIFYSNLKIDSLNSDYLNGDIKLYYDNLDSSTIYDIYKLIKERKIYSYKTINGKSYKVKFK